MTRPTPGGSSQSPGSHRLPVNPRRHKVAPEQRKRVATACNSCNIRRIKCSGDRPCAQCQSGGRDCVYPVIIEKVSISRNELDDLRSRCATLERGLQETVPDQAARQQLLARLATVPAPYQPSESPSPSAATISMDEDRPSPLGDGSLLRDFDGTARWMGGTSGATFLEHLKRFMTAIFPVAFYYDTQTRSSAGSNFLATVGLYQTFDSRPLFVPHVDPMALPSVEEMELMASRVRWFIQDGDGGAASGGNYYWGDFTLPSQSILQATDPKIRRGLAFHLVTYAYASLLDLTTTGSKRDGQQGEAFFARAGELLGNPLDIALFSKDDVPTLTLMAAYLLEMNRRDAAYMYVTVAVHLSMVHGVHQGWVVDEKGKRCFWTLYILDRWICCLMGRTPTIPDGDIRLDMPKHTPGLPFPDGLTANIELSRIAGHIVSNTYGMSRTVEMLEEWYKTPRNLLRMSEEGLGNDRWTCSLHMQYNQLVILAIRPVYFAAVKRAVADCLITRQWDIESHPEIKNIRKCSDAARINLRIGQTLRASAQGQKLLLPELHCIFNAAITIMLHQIAFVNLRTMDTQAVSAAIETFEREASFGDNYGADCHKILVDLNALVGKLRGLMFEHDAARGVNPLAAIGHQLVGEPVQPGGLPTALPTGSAQGSAQGSSFTPISSGSAEGGERKTIYQELVTWLSREDRQRHKGAVPSHETLPSMS